MQHAMRRAADLAGGFALGWQVAACLGQADLTQRQVLLLPGRRVGGAVPCLLCLLQDKAGAAPVASRHLVLQYTGFLLHRPPTLRSMKWSDRREASSRLKVAAMYNCAGQPAAGKCSKHFCVAHIQGSEIPLVYMPIGYD